VRIAVIEHPQQGDPMQDARVLAESSRRASEAGAEIVLMPPALPIDEADAHEEYARLVAGLAGTRLLPRIASGVTPRSSPRRMRFP